MKQKRVNIDIVSSKIVRFIGASVVIALQVCFIGCATPKALDLAKRKASPTYLNLTSIRSAVEQENGDISLCVELGDSNKTESGSYTFSIPHSSLSEGTAAIEALGFRRSLSSPVTCYWYPIEKATRGCVVGNPERGSPEVFLPIERLTVSVEDKYLLCDILTNLKKGPDGANKVYEVTFSEEAREEELHSYDPAAAKEVSEQAKGNKEVVLVYYPSQAPGDGIKPLIIAGGYKETETNLYYLLVPAAVAWDAALIAAAVGVMALGCSGGMGVPGPFTVTTVSP